MTADHATPNTMWSRWTRSASTTMRHASWSALAVVLVVAADAAWRMLNVYWPVFVGYSLLIWAVVPVVATFAIAGLFALFSNIELPLWSTASVAAIGTAAWVSWGVGYRYGGVIYGVLIGAGVLGTSLVLGSSRRTGRRFLAATGIAAATAAAVVVALSLTA